MFSSRFWRRVQRRLKKLQTIVQRNVNVIILVALFLVTTVLPSAAQKVVINIPSPGSLNAENLVQQGRALYEAQQFGDAVKSLELAAANYARNGNQLKLAMTLRNLSLAYQELGLWAEAQEAITKGFKLLENLALLNHGMISPNLERITNSFTRQFIPHLCNAENLNNSAENSQIFAQTLDVQGHLQLARGQAETALQTWEQAAKIYTQTGDWAKFTRNRIVSAQALQMLGLYTQAKKILTEVQQSLEKQEDSALKSTGLRSLGDVLRIVGDLNESQQVLKQSLKVALSLQANPEIAEALISLANAAQDQGDTEASLT
jgi:tetratricopeptide (TPR) repeat protein